MPHTCRIKNRGFPIKEVKHVARKAWRGIAYEQVNKFTCPCCGATETSVVTNGTSVTAARYAALQAW